MSARGDDPARVSAGSLMALEPLAAREMRDAASLAERPGNTATRRRGQGHEIRELRPFTDGDDPRHIDAAATARTGTPQLRSFHEDREHNLMLIADFRRPMLWGTRGRLRSVAAAEALVLAGWRAILAGGAVGVIALTDAGLQAQLPRPRHRGMAGVAGCLERAHAAALEGGRAAAQPLAPMLMQAARQVPRGAGVLLATGLDLPGEGLDAALAALRARGVLQLLLIEDAVEITPPRQALPCADPSGEAGHLRFDPLPAAREERAARYQRQGQTVRRIASDGAGA